MSRPWEKGVFSTYSAFVIEVGFRKDKTGQVYSYHTLQDPIDEETTKNMGSSSHGLEEGAWALLVESIRMESITQLLVLMSLQPDIIKQKIKDNDDVFIQGLVDTVKKQLNSSVEKMVEGFVKQTITEIQKNL